MRCVPNPFGGDGRTDSLGFVLPVDDTHCRIFTVLRSKDTSFFDRIGSLRDRKAAVDLTHFQRFPGDWEAQGGQGPSRCTPKSPWPRATAACGCRVDC